MMRKKLLSYTVAGFIIAAVSLSHQILGLSRDGAAVASASSYAGHRSLSRQEIRLLKSVSYRPDNLLKVSARDVRALLSEPELVRQDQPTTIWQYRSEACVLDVYFQSMREDESAAPVAHYEIRARGKDVSGDTAQGSCIRSLVEERGGLRMVGVSAFYKAR